MEQSELDNITETIEGFEVKNLKYRKPDNIIIGQVKCPYNGTERLGGFINCVWGKNGRVVERYGGRLRKDLYLKIN